jgi:hypothetical protein
MGIMRTTQNTGTRKEMRTRTRNTERHTELEPSWVCFDIKYVGFNNSEAGSRKKLPGRTFNKRNTAG